MQCLFYCGFSVEGKLCINLGRNFPRYDLKDLFPKFNKEAIQGSINLIIDGAAFLFAVGDSHVDKRRILQLL